MLAVLCLVHAALAAPSTRLVPEPAPDPSVFAHTYLVIVGTEHDAVDLVPASAQLPMQVEPVLLTSTAFDGLVPCWQILVAKAFRSQKDAVAYADRLKREFHVDSYVRQTGSYVGPRDVCEEPEPVSEDEGGC
jgi:hypothetical protein